MGGFRPHRPRPRQFHQIGLRARERPQRSEPRRVGVGGLLGDSLHAGSGMRCSVNGPLGLTADTRQSPETKEGSAKCRRRLSPAWAAPRDETGTRQQPGVGGLTMNGSRHGDHAPVAAKGQSRPLAATSVTTPSRRLPAPVAAAWTGDGRACRHGNREAQDGRDEDDREFHGAAPCQSRGRLPVAPGHRNPGASAKYSRTARERARKEPPQSNRRATPDAGMATIGSLAQ